MNAMDGLSKVDVTTWLAFLCNWRTYGWVSAYMHMNFISFIDTEMSQNIEVHLSDDNNILNH